MRSRKRGMALFIVLLLTTVMATLVGAFVAINRQQIALSADTGARQMAYQACMSGLSYVQSRLEADSTFGTTALPNGIACDGPILKVVLGGDHLDGTVHSPGGVEFTFQARLINNIAGSALQNSTILGDVPAHAARVRVEGTYQGLQRRLDVILRKHPFSDSSLASGHDIVIQTSPNSTGWAILSKDISNLVRANHDVYAPSAESDLVKFRGTKGQIRAKRGIYLGGTNVTSSPTFQANSEAHANGQFVPNSRQPAIPDLKADQLRTPATDIPIESGLYEFKDFLYDSWVADAPSGKWLHTQETHRGLETPDRAFADPVSISNSTLEDTRGTDGWQSGSPPTITARPVLWDTGTKKVVADISTGNILVPPGVTLRATGDVDVREGTMAFGYEDGGSQPPSFPAFNVTRQQGVEQMTDLGAALIAGGDIRLGGPVIGLGSLSSEQDISIMAQSGLMITPSVAVAVRAKNSLSMRPPLPNRNPIGLRVDGPVFDTAMGALNRWDALAGQAVLTQPQRIDLMNQLKVKSVGMTGAEAWDLMKLELGVAGSFNPNASPFNGRGYEGTLTLDKYVRLREYMRSGRDDYISGMTDDSIPQMLSGQTALYQMWAKEQTVPLSTFMSQGGIVPDMFFVGLVYAGIGGVHIDSNKNSFYTEGAVVSKGNITVTNTPQTTSVYNRDFLEDIVRRYGSNGVKLDALFFNLQ